MDVVEIAWSPGPREVVLLTVPWRAGLTVDQALRDSGLLDRGSPLDLAVLTIGVWGRAVDRADVVAGGDRIELYRPLQVDPKEARRQRYRAQGPRRKPPQPRRPRSEAPQCGLDDATLKERTPR